MRLKTMRNSLCSILTVGVMSSCSNSCTKHVRPESNPQDTAIMITGREANEASYDAFLNNNETLSQHFSRSFMIRNFYVNRMPEQKLYDMIDEAQGSNNIIISYAGHGAINAVNMADGRTIDAVFYPAYEMRGEVRFDSTRTTTNDLRQNLRYVNNTRTIMDTRADEILQERLEALNLPVNQKNLEYAQFYDPNDNKIFPQEILLKLSNYHGNIAFITNTCFAGQVNELLKEDSRFNALAFASSPYNELSIFTQSTTGIFGRRGGYYLTRALHVQFNSMEASGRVNLADIDVTSFDFIRFARAVSQASIRPNNGLRDNGFNFQRFSRINEFYF